MFMILSCPAQAQDAKKIDAKAPSNDSTTANAAAAAQAASNAAETASEALKESNGEIPKVEDMASTLLSSSGISEQLKAASLEPTGGFGSNSEVWSAFLNSARDGVQGGSMQHYAKTFAGLQDGDASTILNSAVPGESVDSNSLLTMTMGADYNKQLKDVSEAI
jgi:hypothetical protein